MQAKLCPAGLKQDSPVLAAPSALSCSCRLSSVLSVLSELVLHREM